MKKVIVVGSGFSGMSLAYFLQQKGCAVTILEKKEKVGGMISTRQATYGLCESAANGFLNTAKVERFLQAIQADYIGSSEDSKKRYIYRDKPRRWPFFFLETLQLIWKLLFFLPKKKINKMAVPRESVVGWADQNFTSAFADYLLAPALQGIYAGDINTLSASLIINPLLAGKKEKKLSESSLLSAPLGMQSLMQHLEKDLREKGVIFQMNTDWSPMMVYDHLVIATSACDAEKILSQITTEEAKFNADLLNKVEMIPILTATCFFKLPPQEYEGFGILFPRAEKIRALGVLLNNIIFNRSLASNKSMEGREDSSRAHSETWIFGGALDRDILSLSDEQIKSVILQDRARVFSVPQELLDCQITRWPRGLPHYTIEHEKHLSQLKRMKNISLHGNYMGSIGLSRILEKSEQLAEKISVGVS